MKLYLTDKISGDVGGGKGHEAGQLNKDALLATGTDDLAADALELASNHINLVVALEGIGLTIETHDVLIVGIRSDDERLHLAVGDGQWRILAKGINGAVIIIETQDICHLEGLSCIRHSLVGSRAHREATGIVGREIGKDEVGQEIDQDGLDPMTYHDIFRLLGDIDIDALTNQIINGFGGASVTGTEDVPTFQT